MAVIEAGQVVLSTDFQLISAHVDMGIKAIVIGKVYQLSCLERSNLDMTQPFPVSFSLRIVMALKNIAHIQCYY